MTKVQDIKHKGFLKLTAFLKEHTPAALAFSGGTDSAFLAYVASQVLPSGTFMTYTFDTPYMNRVEIDEARDFCKKYDIPHAVLPLPISKEILNNPRNRCYLCKLTLFTTFKKTASRAGMRYFFDGTNTDDLQGFRPGRKALKKLGIISPILESGLGKEEVRLLSKKLKLPTWNKPPNACLLTRLPYSSRITNELLNRIRNAETYLRGLGFCQLRVRTHDNLARIEVHPADMPAMMKKEVREKIIRHLKKIGYDFVTIDMEGFRSGSYDNVK